ncbi:MAG: (4Fe-4S)-binding protein [Deltaproteobacteria bacterium]|nr:MAG: (4Fe-4S)-binding protein [Deltaproteobacteria bacterium]
MIISVASGKGGTGKTTIATNLAAALDEPVHLLDCDVEEPNAHLFLRPEITESLAFEVEVPEIDVGKCTLCGKCQEICQFNAIAILPETALTFPELCHSCGGCSLVCPEDAVMSRKRLIGQVETGCRGKITCTHGRLRVGEAMAPPLIRRVKQEIPSRGLTIIDAPPGASCPVVTSLWGSNAVILVTEPTPFGLNDLELAVGVTRQLNIPCGLVINRADLGDRQVHEYAARENLPILQEIPFDREAAEVYARGGLLVEELPQWQRLMDDLLAKLNQDILPFREIIDAEYP